MSCKSDVSCDGFNDGALSHWFNPKWLNTDVTKLYGILTAATIKRNQQVVHCNLCAITYCKTIVWGAKFSLHNDMSHIWCICAVRVSLARFPIVLDCHFGVHLFSCLHKRCNQRHSPSVPPPFFFRIENPSKSFVFGKHVLHLHLKLKFLMHSMRVSRNCTKDDDGWGHCSTEFKLAIWQTSNIVRTQHCQLQCIKMGVCIILRSILVTRK